MLNKIPQYQRLGNCVDPKEYQERYAKAVQFADYNVGQIIKQLKKQDRYDDALIILTADHGESFTERELWFDHGTTAHEEQLHVPLIIKYPKNRDAGTTDNRLVSLLDIAPTIVQEVSLKALPKATGQALQNPNYKGKEYVIGESSHCKQDPVLTCKPQGPLGKEFAIRNNEVTVMMKGEQVIQYSRKEDFFERKPKAATSSLQKPLNQLASERREQVKSLVWPPRRTLQHQIQMLRQLGYISE
jgi:arylsulfatase A-like enzyme